MEMRKLIKEAYYLKRVFVTLLVVLATLLSLTLSGCTAKTSKPSLEIMPNDDNTISITADKAGISGGGGANITVSEGQKLVIDSTLSNGEIQIRFFRDEAPANPEASVDEILHTNDTPTLDVTVNDAGTTEHTVDPGSYTIMVNVKKTTTGTIIISVR
jgi:3-phosphoglycerate kinase